MPRYIEDVLPLSELNKYAQKGGGIGSLNAMHPYFARRPLTASRAMTLAALVDAPQTEAERQALEQLLVELNDAGKTILMSNHDIAQSLRLARQTVVLRRGAVAIDERSDRLELEALEREVTA